MKNFLKISQKIRLIPETQHEIFQGLIASVKANDFSVILENIPDTSFLNGQNIEISLTTPQCLIKFNSKVVKTEANQIFIAFPADYKRIQRREYTRVNINLPVKYCLPESENILETETSNLSGGGMQIKSPVSIPEGTILQTKIKLNKGKTVIASFELLRSQKNPDKNEFILSGIFKNISNIDRITIIQLCFKRHLELRCLGIYDNNSGGKRH